MGFHHTALATKDLQATHEFYTRAMGFELVKVVVGPTPEGGWAKHAFYETGDDEYIAFWDLHDPHLSEDWSPAISTGQGLPAWVNHLAFKAHSLDDLEACKHRWLDAGHTVMRVDHGFCQSMYTEDPNGILVEFCHTVKPMTDDDKREAERLLADPAPPLEAVPPFEVFEPPK